jgi:hypothetical protein
MGNHYNLQNLKRAIKDPILFHNDLRRINRNLNRNIYKSSYEEGFDVGQEDWDNLIILDGCRYSLFENHADMQGSLSCIISQGGHSNEFMEKTFHGRDLHDTIYITSNPWSEEIGDDVFFLRKTTYTDEVRGGEARLPEDVAQLAVDTFQEYPNKKYIVHFMQPNNPYVGPKAREYRKQLLEKKGVLCTEMDTPGAKDVSEPKKKVQHLRRALRRGYISKEKMMEVYKENLEIVTEHAERVVEELGGKTAVTADHGDMFGERLPPLFVREYSHWEGVYTDYLRKVPWLMKESDTRRSVEAESPLDSEELGDDSVKEHLKSMGYLAD